LVVLLAVLLAGLSLLDRLYPPDLSRLESVSRVVVDRDSRRLRAYLSADGYRRAASTPSEVDPLYLEMLIAFEDKRFRSHCGVDPLALLRAAWQAARSGYVVSGASTLTMQAARLLEPRPRSFANKLIEMARAIQLERRYTKEEILAIYLTLAPFGGNLEGVTAAAWRYFGRAPSRLTADQAALLVALPQSPERLRPDRHPEASRGARDKVLERVADAGLLALGDLARAKVEPVRIASTTLPAAPHLADRLLAAQPAASVVRSSLDGTLQRRWEAVARDWARGLGPRVSVAVLAVENETRRAVAYIGSADFGDAARAGQVDVVRARRSPGSVLKPVIYGLAFERGIAHPATQVDDVPTRFGDYAPANFMRRHYGRVSLSEALRLSLNVPAVALLERLGPVSVVERLRRAGVSLDFGDEAAVPGLAFALGGVGITLEDIVGLYAALADDGRVRKVRYLADPEGEGTRALTEPEKTTARPLFGAVARWYVGEILRGARPPESLLPDLHRRQARPLAFKTGTSYGFRDAWAIGYDGGHTIGVWVGRSDGTPNPGHFGANTAAPLLFRLFDDLSPTERRRPARPAHALALDAPLSPGLRYLGEGLGPAALATGAPPPRILYPLDDTSLTLPPRGRAVMLEAEGGRRPLTWIVNGEPLEQSGARRRLGWTPDGIGFNEIVLVDALGRRAAARVRLVPR
jgi:penicillin-binding protein 1C